MFSKFISIRIGLAIILALVVSSLSAIEAQAAISWVKDMSAGILSNTTLTTPSVNVVAGNLLVVGVLHNTASTPVVSDSQGNVYTKDRSQTFDGTRTVAVYSTIAISTGAVTVNITVTTAQRFGIMLTEFSGVDTSA